MEKHSFVPRRTVFLKEVIEFFRRCDKAEMFEIYGDNLGEHFWNKFKDLHRDWAWWLCSLDTDNLEKFVEYVVNRQLKLKKVM